MHPPELNLPPWPLLLLTAALLCMTGCLFGDQVSGQACDEDRRCAQDTQPVCGQDGNTYACAAYAQCLGVPLEASCGSEPPPVCEPVACNLFCEGGYALGEDGCETCSCKDGPLTCPQTPCMGECPGGYLSDANGCQTCECAPVVCQELACPSEPGLIPCASYALDERGCETCDCAPACEVELCNLDCGELGYELDEQGCETCSCVEVPPACEPLQCEEQCEYGTRKDERGCNTCQCLPAPMCGPVCDVECEWGHKVDDRGCELCACNESPRCQSNEECGLSAVCEERAHDMCCSRGETCNDNIPACEARCVEKAECGFGAQECRPGAQCMERSGSDCCPQGADCDGNLPACPSLCF